MTAAHFSSGLKRGLAAAFAFFLLNSSAFAYIPAVHDAMHCHEDKGSSKSQAASKDLCSVANHLAANLPLDSMPQFKVLQLPEAASLLLEARHVFFTHTCVSSRAPPISPAHP